MQTVWLVVLGVFLCGVHGQEEQFTPDLFSMAKSLQTLQAKVQTLENSQTQQQNRVVAFFATLTTTTEDGKYGPFDVLTTIKYNIVKTNIGNGYNAVTGIFTAPVKGLYVFHFTVFGSMSDPPKTAVVLKKNTEELAFIVDAASTDPQDYGTRVAVVSLEMGDTVFVEQLANNFFYAKYINSNSFSGFLLSPM